MAKQKAFYSEIDQFPNINMGKTGKNIKKLIKGKGLTASNVCELLGDISKQAVYKWYRGESIPSIDNLYALKTILGLDSIECLIVTDADYNVTFGDIKLN